MAELMVRKIFLPGVNDDDQLGKIFHIFGTPTEKEWPRMESLRNFSKFDHREGIDLKDHFKLYSDEAVDLFKKLMTIDPQKRPSASQALQHPFFQTSKNPATHPSDLPFQMLEEGDKAS